MKQLWIVSALVVGALAAGTVLVAGHDKMQSGGSAGSGTPAASPIGLPWQIQALPGGQTQVMGLVLGTSSSGAAASTLADVHRVWGANVEVAIIAAPGETGSLEAFVDPAQAGFISGKLVVTLNAPAEAVKGMRERALKSEFMESTTRKYTLTLADQQAAKGYAVAAMAFIPQANLDEATVLDRFGQPSERRRMGVGAEHFLYPAKGLDVTLNQPGKDVLQYVAPADFHKLLTPLQSR